MWPDDDAVNFGDIGDYVFSLEDQIREQEKKLNDLGFMNNQLRKSLPIEIKNKMCRHKRRYESKEYAATIHDAMATYKCPLCLGWHLTSRGS